MNVIFTKNGGRWKFYAFVSNTEHLQSELDHLKEQNVSAMTQPVTSFDADQIHELETKLNA